MTKLKDKIFKIFVDFDGTITKNDVGEEMFLKFGHPEEAYKIIKLWMNDEISSTESWKRLCDTIVDMDEDDFYTFVDSMEIDPSFKKFVNYCDENEFEIKILSDGLDYYISRILKREKLDHLTVFTNKGKWIEPGTIEPSFPYTDEECKQCANCKRNHIINYSSDTDFTIYIGDGYSDKCPAQHCDFIFAKHSLLKFCETNRISYYPFNNFNDVMDRLDDLKSRNRLKKRHQAELKRREVYMQG